MTSGCLNVNLVKTYTRNMEYIGKNDFKAAQALKHCYRVGKESPSVTAMYMADSIHEYKNSLTGNFVSKLYKKIKFNLSLDFARGKKSDITKAFWQNFDNLYKGANDTGKFKSRDARKLILEVRTKTGLSPSELKRSQAKVIDFNNTVNQPNSEELKMAF